MIDKKKIKFKPSAKNSNLKVPNAVSVNGSSTLQEYGTLSRNASVEKIKPPKKHPSRNTLNVGLSSKMLYKSLQDPLR